MRPVALTLTMLVLTFSGSALAEGEGTPAGYSVTCSAGLRDAGCFIERPVLVIGALELAFGFDARASWADWERSYASPYAILAWYADSWSAWAEFAIPESRIPSIGKTDPLRVGVTWRY
jgi:hypothetical protein